MSDKSVVIATGLPLPLFIKGKVRDTYNLGKYLLIVATDRISAFDVVLPEGIPGKGTVLNLFSAFWFKQTENIIPNHVVETINDIRQFDKYFPGNDKSSLPDYLLKRSMIVKKTERLPLECVVRGYLAGSGWLEYQKRGSVCGIPLPRGLRESEALPEPVFTPTTKADTGHDMPMSYAEVVNMVGNQIAADLKNIAITVYDYARQYANTRGIIIADTKMEFGIDDDGKLILIDELLTPDSSRFWDAASYRIGQSQESYDKQPVRDWLAQSGWNKESPAPNLPSAVITGTTERYLTAFKRITGQEIL